MAIPARRPRALPVRAITVLAVEPDVKAAARSVRAEDPADAYASLSQKRIDLAAAQDTLGAAIPGRRRRDPPRRRAGRR